MKIPPELKKKYLIHRLSDLQNLMSSLENDDFMPAMKLGHQVKGNAVTFDFPQMANLGVQIEKAAKLKDKESVRFLAQKMRHEIDSVSSSWI